MGVGDIKVDLDECLGTGGDFTQVFRCVKRCRLGSLTGSLVGFDALFFVSCHVVLNISNENKERLNTRSEQAYDGKVSESAITSVVTRRHI